MNIFKLLQGVDNDLPEVMVDDYLYLTTDTKRTFIGGKELQKKQLENYAPSEEENEALLIKNGDTVEEAFGKLEASVINNEYVTAKAMTTLNDSCGFNEEGIFTPDSDAECTKNASSVKEALTELDNAIVKNEKVVAKAITTLNDSCGFDENGIYTPEGYSEYIKDAKTVASALQKLDSALQDVADNAGGGDLSRAEMESYISSLNHISSATMNTELSKKVDKVSGKELSTNDFTNELKSKLDNLSNYNDAEVRGMISSLNTALNTLIGTEGSVTEAIDTVNEITAFLNTYKNNDTLASVLQTLETNLHTWVENKGYLTSHQSLANYALNSTVTALEARVKALEDALASATNFEKNEN